MIIARTVAEARSLRRSMRDERVALVPTMGALHAGHLDHIHRAKKVASRVFVSVFVNPTQFGPNEDFQRYPRPFEADAELCREAGADCVFAPSVDEMYPPSVLDA